MVNSFYGEVVVGPCIWLPRNVDPGYACQPRPSIDLINELGYVFTLPFDKYCNGSVFFISGKTHQRKGRCHPLRKKAKTYPLHDPIYPYGRCSLHAFSTNSPPKADNMFSSFGSPTRASLTPSRSVLTGITLIFLFSSTSCMPTSPKCS